MARKELRQMNLRVPADVLELLQTFTEFEVKHNYSAVIVRLVREEAARMARRQEASESAGHAAVED